MKQFAVIGLGRFGSAVAKTLSEKGYEVLAVDSNEECVQDASEYVAHAVTIDATDEKALRAVGIEHVDCAIVGIGADIEASILVTVTLKEIGIKEIIARAMTEVHGKVLEKIGVTKVVFAERDMGIRAANALISPEIIEYIDLSPEYSIFEILPPKDFIGKTLRELDIRAKYNLNVIAIKRKVKIKSERGFEEREKINISPSANDVIVEGDKLIVIGTDEAISKLS
ncbi:MAG: hypothetical protein AMJ78_03885 [Omnitrophica WOR_2 bacterium SM23_29]|nr:MAG: hypothetical protein AMJ78_03885 [Omnitrophica WOR_2 bacterium SM23_29]